MNKKSGIIYELENGLFGVALYSEIEQFSKGGKVLLHLYYDAQCLCPKLRLDQRQYNVIESISNLKQVGIY